MIEIIALTIGAVFGAANIGLLAAINFRLGRALAKIEHHDARITVLEQRKAA